MAVVRVASFEVGLVDLGTYFGYCVSPSSLASSLDCQTFLRFSTQFPASSLGF